MGIFMMLVVLMLCTAMHVLATLTHLKNSLGWWLLRPGNLPLTLQGCLLSLQLALELVQCQVPSSYLRSQNVLGSPIPAWKGIQDGRDELSFSAGHSSSLELTSTLIDFLKKAVNGLSALKSEVGQSGRDL
jgi:hypothetical protein